MFTGTARTTDMERLLDTSNCEPSLTGAIQYCWRADLPITPEGRRKALHVSQQCGIIFSSDVGFHVHTGCSRTNCYLCSCWQGGCYHTSAHLLPPCPIYRSRCLLQLTRHHLRLRHKCMLSCLCCPCLMKFLGGRTHYSTVRQVECEQSLCWAQLLQKRQCLLCP